MTKEKKRPNILRTFTLGLIVDSLYCLMHNEAIEREEKEVANNS